jgi:nucleotide-binding universal stress UspA family protein
MTSESSRQVKPIVVGVDESVEASRALRWAVHEARRRDTRVLAVLAWSFLDQHTSGRARFEPDYDASTASAALDQMIRDALDGDADGLVEPRVVCDVPARALLDAAAEAQLLVVGARGLGGFRGLLLGSVSRQCLHHAEVPTVVVRAKEQGGSGIVVGVDGSEAAQAALRWAVDEARLRDTGLTVVHAYPLAPFGVYPYASMSIDAGLLPKAAEKVLDGCVEAVDASGVRLTRVTAVGGAAAPLVEMSEKAELVVVGSRGAGLLARMTLGSVAAQVAAHAACPVAVIPHRHDRG